MKERPILFSGPMVKAILEGRKTQTRRVVKPQPVISDGETMRFREGDSATPDSWVIETHREEIGELVVSGGRFTDIRCPYGQPGDRLWVRETFILECDVNGNPPPFDDGRPIQRDETIDSVSSWMQPHYLATDPAPDLVCQNPAHDGGPCCHWRPSIFMPRWASRINLEITKISVERLEEISEADAQAEGCEQTKCDHPDCDDHFYGYRASYCLLWNQINSKKYPWGTNPWVWVIEFKRVAL